MTARWLCLAFALIPSFALAGMSELFDKLSKDFGNVAHGSITVHKFRVKNTTDQPISISGVTSSCVCAIPLITKRDANPGEELTIEVKYDARTFVGPRSMQIRVNFERPYFEQVVLNISGHSRSDIVFKPGTIEFGSVTTGSDVVQTARIEYTGANDFRIREIQPTTFYDADLKEVARVPGQRVSYEITVKPKKQVPNGSVAEAIGLLTNDNLTPQIHLYTNGTFQGMLVATPKRLILARFQSVKRPADAF